jgi:hypothetical protein
MPPSGRQFNGGQTVADTFGNALAGDVGLARIPSGRPSRSNVLQLDAAASPAHNRAIAVESARNPDADRNVHAPERARNVKLLIQFAVEWSLSGA